MSEFTSILLRHAEAYGAMECADAVKLCYQAEFGGEHLLRHAEAALPLIREEYSSAPADAALSEPCGERVSRLYLGPAREAGLPAETVARLFFRSAQERGGSVGGFLQRLSDLKESIDAFPFDLQTLDRFLAGYDFSALPPLRHSESYRRLYRPAYRLISVRYEQLLPLLCAMEDLLRKKGRVVVALDGNCGGGKTTLSELLAPLYDSTLIHMDDFFLPPELRTPERRERGNVHYERFGEEVLTPLIRGEAFEYRRFSCRKGGYCGSVRAEARPVTIIEGTYSCHPYFGPGAYDLRVFVETSPEEQARRIRLRGGEDCYEQFRTLWIPLENQYFAANQTRSQANLIIRT
ncbi:hypothetical protein KQI82_03270 [Oscillibacter sp. MSJ-2]|uniref:Uridine kinase n=1 Tax=Dysosmobacter acutus TaxID=2841504 RepID=A0ABS6F9H5_9FIRM|nr:hypothetical protein [Dysosmobacter acutus]MBU5625959.1 hypothetical protein [Dysosmobacter acutus]